LDVKKGILLYDLQYPNHNPKLLKLWEQYLADHEWDYLIYGGDIMDMDAISHHALKAGNIRDIEGKRLKDDYNYVSEMLTRHRNIVGSSTDIYWLQGNHEDWAEKLVDKIPGLEGLIEVEANLPLQELGIKVIEPRGYLKLGKLHFIHGDIGRGYTPVFHAKKVVETYNRNVVYGHHHTLQTATKLSPLGIQETHTAHCIPCMADTTPQWNQGKPTAWLNGFGVFYVSRSSFTVLPVVAAQDSFISPEGHLYK
jgi:hypothetical protein